MNDETRRKFLVRSIGSLGAAIPIIYYGCDSGGSRGGPLGPLGAGVFTPTSILFLLSLSFALSSSVLKTLSTTPATRPFTHA